MHRIAPAVSVAAATLAASAVTGVLGLAAPAAYAAPVPSAAWGTSSGHRAAGGFGAPRRAAAPAYHLAWRADEAFSASIPHVTTCRFIAKLTGSGSQIRVEFADPYGARGFPILAASVAQVPSASRLDIDPSTSVPLTFQGNATATVAGHGTVLTDPVPMTVVPGSSIAVTVSAGAGDAYQKASPTEVTGCTTGAASGTAPASSFPVDSRTRWMTGVQVLGTAPRTIAALGDSLTEGGAVFSDGQYYRWTDFLSRSGAFVANAGVGGNTLTGVGFFDSVNALSRQQTLITEPGITDEVIELGTNDLGFGRSQSAMLSSLADIITLARRHGITVWVTTIPPRSDGAWTADKEQQRQQLNALLRSGWVITRGADVIDLDAALRDARHLQQLNPSYAFTDRLHLNAAGDLQFARTVARELGLAGV